MTDDGCECACHVGGAFRPACDVPGGCGSNHRSRVMCILRHKKPAQATHGLLCEHHLAMLREQLAEIVEFWALLPSLDSSVPFEGQREERHTKKPFPAAPIRLDVLALSDPRNFAVGGIPMSYERNWNPARDRLEGNGNDIYDVPGTLTSWCQMIAEEREFTPIIGQSIVELVAFLQRNLDWIAYQDWIDEFATDLRGIRRDLAFTSGQPQPKPIGNCPELLDDGYCDTVLFAEKDGSVKCRHCKRSWSGMELVRLKLLQREEPA